MYTIENLSNRVRWIGEFYHDEQVISYLFEWDKKAILFDSGMWILNIKEEVEKITSLPTMIANTHSHFDHIWWNHLFSEIAIPNNQEAILMAEKWPSKENIEKYYAKENFFSLPKWFNLWDFLIKPFNPSQLLKEWDLIEIFPFKFKVICTPWHSNDSICFYEENEWWLIAGDTLYPWPIYINNPCLYIDSVRKIFNLKIKMIFPAHNEFTFNTNLLWKINENVHKLIENNDIVIEWRTRLVNTQNL